MEKEIKQYIPNIALIRELETKFNGDLQTAAFSSKKDFETYLCALAYGSIGVELFYDAKIAYKLDDKLKNNDEFMQGMAAYSIMQKMNKAEDIMYSSEFQEKMTIAFNEERYSHDYATVAFVMYYLSTKGYKVQWDKMCHDFCPINLSKGPVEFKKGAATNPEQMLENVKADLNVHSL